MHRPWLGSISLEELPKVPGYAVMELIQDADNADKLDEAMRLVAPLDIVWPTETDCDLALHIFSANRLSHGMGPLDALIGACALGSDRALCTFNAKHFRGISGLRVEQPYKR